ncbi:MAG: hypothetical protein BWK80_39125 [Desulfobacteraceae bacterium IS3]|nr:MAG: hypothetical protein BWK80_39125 [Desulfobacteraceae bacterium IS3]
MKDEIKKLLFDINEAADSVFEYLGERRDFSEYNKNKMLRRAVEREFEIIGEAMNHILKIDPNFPIRYARRIVDLRNLVIHGYDQVDHAIIWGIISRDLPNMRNEVMKLLDNNEENTQRVISR